MAGPTDESAKKASSSPMPVATGIGRKSAKVILQVKIGRREKDVDALRVLLNYIPWDTLSKEDEELLWGYFVQRD